MKNKTKNNVQVQFTVSSVLFEVRVLRLACTVGDKIKFRIPLCTTAIARLKNGGKMVRCLVKKGCYCVNLSRSPHASLQRSIKIVDPIKRSDFCLQAPNR